MYKIKTSDFFNDTIDKKLFNIDVVKNISQDFFYFQIQQFVCSVFFIFQNRILFQRKYKSLLYNGRKKSKKQRKYIA